MGNLLNCIHHFIVTLPQQVLGGSGNVPNGRNSPPIK